MQLAATRQVMLFPTLGFANYALVQLNQASFVVEMVVMMVLLVPVATLAAFLITLHQQQHQLLNPHKIVQILMDFALGLEREPFATRGSPQMMKGWSVNPMVPLTTVDKTQTAFVVGKRRW